MLSAYAVTTPGFESITSGELSALGLVVDNAEPGGVGFRAGARELVLANLHLRTASRILVRLGSFHARVFGELERHAQALPWAEYLAPGRGVAFRVTSRKSKLYHEDAIAERLMRAALVAVPGGQAASWPGDDAGGDDEAHAPQRFIVRVFRDQVTVSADASGTLLHRRGYRKAVARAPLRETMAAAMLLGVGWDGSLPLVDPFAGSGTIPIEAAMIARRMAPGLGRRFAAESWPGIPAEVWPEARAAAAAMVRPSSAVPVVAADRDPGAVEAMRANADRAGVAGDLEIRRAVISDLALPPDAGWIVTNPPYGVRVGERQRLRNLYAQLGHLLRERARGWQVAMLSAHSGFERQVGLDWGVRWQASNGGIGVRLVSAHVPREE